MTNPIHVLSVAALLLVAFLVGAVIGTLVRLLALRLGRKPEMVAPAAVEAAPVGRPLVSAPVIAPLPVAAAQVVPPPAEVPVPDFAATLIALANEAPPASFIEASKPRVEAVAAKPMPESQPVPEFPQVAAVTTLSASPAMQPAHVAGETTSGVHVDAPKHDSPPAAEATRMESPEPRTAEVIQFPTSAAEPAAAHPTDIVVGGESVAVVDTSDLEVIELGIAEASAVANPAAMMSEPETEMTLGPVHYDHFRFVRTAPPSVAKPDAVPAPEPASRSETIPIPVIAANSAVDAVLAALPRPEVVEARGPVADRPARPAAVVEPVSAEAGLAVESVEANVVLPAPAPEPILKQQEAVAVTVADAVEAPAVEPVVDVADPAEVEQEPEPLAPVADSEPIAVSVDEPLDEDAAMRAIEGNWSPRRTPPKRPVRPPAEPDGANQAVAASARAVTAARRTAEAVVAEVAEVQAEAKAEAGRPAGLDGPRDGRKDDLTHIIGVLPVIETALNKLGLYHFDQMGALTDEQIGWIETHLGVPGRISRELWREQARELSAVLKPKRVAEK